MVIQLSGGQFGLSEIIRVISKSNERAQRKFDFKLSHKYDFRPKLHDLKFNCHTI